MDDLREAVTSLIQECADNEELFVRQIESLAADSGDNSVFSIFFSIMTHLDLNPSHAASCWKKVLAHRQEMMQAMGRKISLVTVLCDYFSWVEQSLKHPVLMENHVFEQQINSLKHDNLTGLYTRTAFDETLQREIARARRHGSQLSLLFMDIDDFKQVNDIHGHIAGDLVLKDVADTITSRIRAEDVAARYGGEEIVVILPRTGKVAGLILAERIREKVGNLKFCHEEKNIGITLSCGLATFPIDADDARQLLICADRAMYNAKEFGKNNVMVYSCDKRRYLRVNFDEPVEVRQIGFAADTPQSPAYGKNISMAGLLFESEVFHEIGTRMEILIPLGSGRPPVLVIGTVVRVEIFGEKRFDIGVSFLSLDKTVRNEISRYMLRQLELGGKEGEK